MTAVLAWLTGRVAGPVLGAVSAALLLALIILWAVDAWKISSLTNEVSDLRSRYTQCTVNVGTLDASVKALNSQVDKLATDTKAQNEAVAKAMDATAVSLRGIRASTSKLLSLPATAPVGSLQACRAGALFLKGKTP